MDVNLPVNSNQATSRHIDVLAYRCFLPDLTGFTSIYCARPNSQHYLTSADSTISVLSLSINPATADCGLQGTATSPSSTAYLWRRERDSNPRGHDSLTRFPGVPLSQLGHLSNNIHFNSILYMPSIHLFLTFTSKKILHHQTTFIF